MDQVRVIVAGGLPYLRNGIAAALAEEPRLKLLAKEEDSESAATRARQLACDVLVVHSDVPHIEARRVMERLAEGPTSARVLILTENDSRAELLATLRLGVPGYGNLRRLAPEELCAGVLAVAVHGAWMCPVSVAHLIALVALQPHGQPVRLSYVDVLSEREQQVLRLVASGTGDRQVAATLCLSENTVKTYIGRIREKLDVPTRHDAVRRAIQLGLVPDRRFNTA